MRVRLIANPSASRVAPALVDGVVARLSAVADVELRRTERAGHATELAAEPGADVVIGMGGDGTANEIVNGVAAGAVVGVIPAGATSVLARQLGLPAKPLPAATMLAAAIEEQRWRPLGLGSLNGRLFTFAAGFGIEAEAMRLVAERRAARPDHRRPGDIAVVGAAISVLRADRFSLRERMTIRTGGGEVRAAYVAIANGHPYTYFGRIPVRTAPRAGPGSALDAVAVGGLRPAQLWRLAAYGLVWPRHASGRDSHVVYLHDIDALDLAADVPLAAHVDGEYMGLIESAEVRYRPGAVRVLIPPAAAASFPVPGPAAAGR
ncbi:MAG TPA: diacylglycerol kinase family protein [Gaiellales bacterium]|nr:diacylglycerol kinase family protein [Gaiellales bacterium]